MNLAKIGFVDELSKKVVGVAVLSATAAALFFSPKPKEEKLR